MNRDKQVMKNRPSGLQSQASNEPGRNGLASITDQRPGTILQRQLQNTMQASTLQRRIAQGSDRFRRIAGEMGEKYGVDTSGLRARHQSSFPRSLGAEATIQGNQIHFAPGKDTTYNMRHEVAHAIDNTLNGTPRGDQMVNGHRVDTTREEVVDRMARE